ncbi:MAG: OadG family protein [Spirochaetales bacterium]|uniref:OadG family protein n=1 Tax=Candidatus Thalassospirochaeta sargassi TaxID=3119039 RepID=A0AAJ1MP02_9SPIO|nr:OadG family protein [Spirochaetales bacterium]
MQEQFSYSLMASGLGILIVFTILVLLSVLMIIIRRLSDEKTEKPVTSTQPTAVQTAPQSSLPLPVMVAAATEGMTMGGNADWLIAAVAAYFAIEENDAAGPSAAAWASTYVKYDPWVANNKLSKTVPGV